MDPILSRSQKAKTPQYEKKNENSDRKIANGLYLDNTGRNSSFSLLSKSWSLSFLKHQIGICGHKKSSDFVQPYSTFKCYYGFISKSTNCSLDL